MSEHQNSHLPESATVAGLSWDPQFMRRVVAALKPIVKVWFRSEVIGLERIPAGGGLLVSNHSGGLLPMDLPVLAVDFLEYFDFRRPLVALGHDVLFRGPQGDLFRRSGLVPANRRTADQALRSGSIVVVFPGGDYDAFRPSRSANVIDFGGRTGYVSTALKAGVPIVPSVSIGGQESQIFLTRGRWLGKRLGLKRILRTDVLPLTLGFPFGLASIGPVNLPLPTKIVTEVLEPVDIADRFGADPDPVVVDAYVREVMQTALNRLAVRRRLPVIG